MGSIAPTTVRVLCFGASITAGFHMWGLAHHPYRHQLLSRLQQSFPNANVNIEIEAKSGDTIVGGQYMKRLQRHCSPEKYGLYDWVIVQGGGNDLSWGKTPEEIYEELQLIWDLVLQSGASVLALTVTETDSTSSLLRDKYAALNKMILNHRENGYHVADVCKAVPYNAMPKDLRKKIWDDGLHFKKAGYNMLGDAIADRLIDILQSGPLAKI